ncbi:MAG: alpha/beta fold hydrolase [Verrucomicrobiae bacterium]|nr:alpha/beta fold hydrolase [Verrucomicrobiae bacterium]
MKLHYRKIGSGPPLLVLHGLLGSLDNWQPVTQRLAERFTVFALDLRNHGLSPHSPDMSLETLSEDVAKFVRDHGLERIHLLGHSLGGRVVMHFALHRAGSVERLVVADMSPRAPDPARAVAVRAMLAALRRLPVQTARTREELDAALAQDVPDPAARQFLLKNLVRERNGGFRWKVNLDALWQNHSRLAVAVHAPVPCPRPALFLRGERSDFVLPADEPLIRELFPYAQIHTVPNAGHWLQVEQPEYVAAVIRTFLTGHTGSEPRMPVPGPQADAALGN